jgi:hypothetical protein
MNLKILVFMEILELIPHRYQEAAPYFFSINPKPPALPGSSEERKNAFD